MTPRFVPAAVVLACLLLYLGISVTDLDRFPVVLQDEPWTSSPALKLELHGVYGADLFAGYYHAGQRYYQIPPAYPVLVAASFKLFGIGIIQARLIGVLCGFLTLLLTYLVGRRLVGTVPAILAVVLLVTWRITKWDGILGSGMPLIDVSRVARYDVAIAPCVLLATGLFVAGLSHGGRWRFLVAGWLVGIAALFHVYAPAWLAAFAAVVIWQGGWRALRRRDIYLTLLGFGLGVAPWLYYIALDTGDYLHQMSMYRDRFQLLDPSFYVRNLLREPERYTFGLRTGGLRLGSLLFLVAVPLSLVGLLWESRHTRQPEPAAVAFGWLIPELALALVVSEKLVNHTIGLMPFVTLAVGWGVWRLWNGFADRYVLRSVLRLGLAVGAVVVVVDGGVGLLHQRAVAASTTPYTTFTSRIDRVLPAHATIVGNPQFQLGLYPHPYRSFFLPVLLASRDTSSHPLSFDAAFERVHPDAILIDRPLATYFTQLNQPSNPEHVWLGEFRSYLCRHQARLVAQITDRSYYYSPVRVYLMENTAHHPAARPRKVPTCSPSWTV